MTGRDSDVRDRRVEDIGVLGLVSTRDWIWIRSGGVDMPVLDKKDSGAIEGGGTGDKGVSIGENGATAEG